MGRSESGKTTLITALVTEIRARGFSVAVIKHCPRGFDLDMEGKDSWRFKEAGADGVFLLSPQRVGMVEDVREEPSVSQIVSKSFSNMDFVLTEGCPGEAPVLKIEVLRASVSREPISEPGELTAVVTDFDIGLDLPQFRPEDTSEIVEFMEGFMRRESGEYVELKVNGKGIHLNPFVQNVFRNTVIGIVSSLRIDEEPEVIELRILEGGEREEKTKGA